MKGVLAAAGLLMATSAYAQPVTITVDDFATSQLVVDTSPNAPDARSDVTYTIDGNTFTRTLIVNQTATLSGGSSIGLIGDPDETDDIEASIFSLTNVDGTDSTMELVYDIDALTDDFVGGSELRMSVLFADAASGEVFTIAGFLNGEQLGSETFAGAGQLDFALSSLLDSGNELRLVFTGGTGWDATLDDITVFAAGGEEPVPEPAALGLFGLGLAAVALGRRRKTA